MIGDREKYRKIQKNDVEKEEEIEVEITASTLRLGQYLRVHDRVHAYIVPQLKVEFGKNERNGGMIRKGEIKE